ncbi:serine hydrolase [Streptomyces sp. JJ38]|uniref:serine hydrolase domain-containing protein n=1 Tax=Streptomyces sp. JJ38 TaxID=2738128 RepID=UPI001C581120|nr:serine hydrolase domain-containing protein [Streptomyces sp. JJ38]MBW1597083.1 beta-lactamase family protein [Streptomyces sp. JJ38]
MTAGLRDAAPAGPRLRDAVREAAGTLDGPDTVVAVSRGGERYVHAGGDGPTPPAEREHLRYEIGSASKTYTVLLTAHLAELGLAGLHDPVTVHLPPTPPDGHRDAITLAHLATHTSGLPRLPHDPVFLRQLATAYRTNPYARYDTERLVYAFARTRPRRPPGQRWWYSNFGAALLGQALAHTTGTPYADLLTDHVLGPLGLGNTGLHPGVPGRDAPGHRRDGATPVPPLVMRAFAPAGAVRATPHDLLTFLEAHLTPAATPLTAALRAVTRPVLRRGAKPRQTHTLTWFQEGDALYHPGATPGHEAFLGFNPATRTAVAVLAARGWSRRSPLGAIGYDLLTGTS